MSEDPEAAFERSDDPPQVTPLRRRARKRQAVMPPAVHPGRLVLALLFVGLLTGGAFFFAGHHRTNYALILDSRLLVVLRSREDATAALLALKRKYAAAAPELVSFREGTKVRIQAWKNTEHVLTRDEAVRKLDAQLTIILTGPIIKVNGKPLVMLASPEAAGQALSLMLQRGSRGRAGSPTFKERITTPTVTFVEGEQDFLPVVTPKEAAAQLVHPPRKAFYIVGKGDSFWTIGQAYGLTVEQLQKLNPGVDYRKLDVGDRVELPDQPAPVTVVVVTRQR